MLLYYVALQLSSYINFLWQSPALWSQSSVIWPLVFRFISIQCLTWFFPHVWEEGWLSRAWFIACLPPQLWTEKCWATSLSSYCCFCKKNHRSQCEALEFHSKWSASLWCTFKHWHLLRNLVRGKHHILALSHSKCTKSYHLKTLHKHSINVQQWRCGCLLAHMMSTFHKLYPFPLGSHCHTEKIPISRAQG